MFRTFIPGLLALLLGAGSVYAQEYSFRSFGVAEGLNNLGVRGIYQDHIGFLWVSTEDGIFRYDGDRFELFGAAQGVSTNAASAFGDAPDGSLLIGADFGLFHLNGNRFEPVPGPFKTISWAQGIQADGKGHTLLATDAGLVELSQAAGTHGFVLRTLTQVSGTSDPSVSSVYVDGEVLWYGCGLELCRKDAAGTRVFGLENGLPGKPIQVIRKDGTGNLWIRARNAGVFELPAGQSGFVRPTLPFPAENLGGVPAVDSDGRMLFPTPDGLLIQEGNGWRKIDRSRGLRGTVYAAFEDRQRALWIGLAGRGLAQWRGYGEWQSYSAVSGLSSDLVYEILPRPDGSLMVATEAGLLEGKHLEFDAEFKPVKGLGGFPVHSVQTAPDGDIWIGTETRGAAHINGHTGAVEWFGEKQGLTGKAAYTLRFDHNQRLWAATEAGLFVSKAPFKKFARVAELPAKRFWAVAEGSDGTIWAGGAGGLFEYAGGHWKNFKRADGLSNQEVLSLGAGPNGVIWVGYRFGGGIDRVSAHGEGFAIQKGVQRAGTDGLVYFLNYDAHGRLWAGTERGVDMWDGQRWNHYDMSDGLAWDDCNLNAFAEEPDGTVWIGTGGGLSRFKPRLRAATEVPLEVVFTRLMMGQTDVSTLHDPSFGARANSLVVRYSALNAQRENGVIFRYRLGGAISNWTETDQRELHFANLAPGGYRLEVEAQDSDGLWSVHSAEFPFEIRTPWYWRWWFVSLCIVIPLSVAAGVIRLRLRGARHRERELVQLVEARTADLRHANEELSRLSFTDPLTGLANRRVFDQALERECARIQRSGSSVSLLSIDADHFKALNDSEGHQRGDECLILLATELTRVCRRQMDVPARCGGEEFAVVLPDTDAAEAARFAEVVRQSVADLKVLHPASPVAPYLTVSVGVATATAANPCSRDELAAAADRALYAAKRGGRNRVCIALQEFFQEEHAT